MSTYHHTQQSQSPSPSPSPSPSYDPYFLFINLLLGIYDDVTFNRKPSETDIELFNFYKYSIDRGGLDISYCKPEIRQIYSFLISKFQ